jgi:Putative DNA-binding domain
VHPGVVAVWRWGPRLSWTNLTIMVDRWSPAWTTRLRDVFGAPLADVRQEHIEGLVASGAREAADLDFKASLYGKTEQAMRELCKDIAAMRNDRGGVIVLGVADEDGIAVDCPEVQLSDDEERRMRQIVASGTTPHAAFDMQAVPGKTSGKGFYLLIAQPSPFRPHAVVVGEGFRYPRRDGSTTRYLSEIEIADMYRSRFRGESEQLDRLERIGQEALGRVAEDGPWVVASLVPNNSGALPISFAGRTAIEQWARAECCSNDAVDGFFPVAAMASVGVERYSIATVHDGGKRPTAAYAQCHVDGAGSAALVFYQQGTEPDGITVFDTDILWRTAKALRLIGRHAVRAGAYGDAAVHLQLAGESMYLGSYRGGVPQRFRDTELSISQAHSRHTVPLESLVGDPQNLLAATRLMLNDIFNAFGRAEIPHIALDGTLRLPYFRDSELAKWAEARGVPATAETLPE